MKVFIGMDDTDSLDSDYGTGKVTRWFSEHLPEGCACIGVVRQQLLVSDEIPYTSHNSAACMIVHAPDDGPADRLVRNLADLAADHLLEHAAEGSDPGLCVAAESDSALSGLHDFGRLCTHRVCSQKQALSAVNGGFLQGLGGTDDGLIGAAAAVGLTASGWSGRYIELGDLRGFGRTVSVAELGRLGIEVVSTERDACVPAPGDTVETNGWVRPHLLGGKPALLVAPSGEGRWVNIHHKRKKKPREAAC